MRQSSIVVDGIPPRTLWTYTRGRGPDRTVMVAAEACGGWVIVQRVEENGTVRRVPIKASSLRPLAPQLF